MTYDGHHGRVLSCAVSLSSKERPKQILLTGGYDRIFKLWDLESGTCLESLSPEIGRIRTVAISPCGFFIAGGGEPKNHLLISPRLSLCPEA